MNRLIENIQSSFQTFPNASVFGSNACLLDVKPWTTKPDSSMKMNLMKPATNLPNVLYATIAECF